MANTERCELTSEPQVRCDDRLGRTASIIHGLGEQNEPATFEGRKGYWVQADCVFIEARDAATAIVKYRRELEMARIGCSHNHFCGSILAGKRREWINAIAKDPSCHSSLKQALQQDAP